MQCYLDTSAPSAYGGERYNNKNLGALGVLAVPVSDYRLPTTRLLANLRGDTLLRPIARCVYTVKATSKYRERWGSYGGAAFCRARAGDGETAGSARARLGWGDADRLSGGRRGLG